MTSIKGTMPPFAIHGQIANLKDVYLLPRCVNCNAIIHNGDSKAQAIRESQLVCQFIANAEAIIRDNMNDDLHMDAFDGRTKQRMFLNYVSQNFVGFHDSSSNEKGDEEWADFKVPITKINSSLQLYFRCPNYEQCLSNHFVWDFSLKLAIRDSLTFLETILIVPSRVLDQQITRLRNDQFDPSPQFQMEKFFAPWILNKTLYLWQILGIIEGKDNSFYFHLMEGSEKVVKKIEASEFPFVARVLVYGTDPAIYHGYECENFAGLRPQPTTENDGTKPLTIGWNGNDRYEFDDDVRWQNVKKIRDIGAEESEQEDIDEESSSNERPASRNQKLTSRISRPSSRSPKISRERRGERSSGRRSTFKPRQLENLRDVSKRKKSRKLPSSDNAPFALEDVMSVAALNNARTFSRDIQMTLFTWLYDHLDNPYPLDLELYQLQQLTGLDKRRLSSWFHYHQKRSFEKLWKIRESKMGSE
ncbi:hypothetical protein DASC09_003980 [Saccharomycopsis crataegensis]|uniref:KN homeodomain domain-containing protein n=1 Tax=Saccharomycopsis crataegensis TaxID=43959 RepID=A0AAV5QFV4_9ASCO|nr:hypothetical protein DASC09_003980 [Saccharomycopsis crataegensis]